MIHNIHFPIFLKSSATAAGAAVTAFIGPVLPYGAICTAMITADLISARLLARRLCRRSPASLRSTKFSSRRLGDTVMTLIRSYALLLLSHGIDLVIICDTEPFSMLRFSAGLICFWQFWSILENESSANDAPWARIAQRILVDKTERHLGIDLSDLKDKHQQ